MWSLILLLACSEGEPSPAAPAGAPTSPTTTVKTVTIAASPWQEAITATGVIEVRDSVELRPEASGVIAEVAFSDGARVAQGQLLVRLRDADARAQLAEAEARHSLAELTLKRLEDLRASDNASQAELDQGRAERDLAAAQVARAREALRRTRIVAPFDGVVGRRDVTVGTTVDPSRVLTRLDGLAVLVVDVSVSEDEAGRVQVGQPAIISTSATPETPIAGKVSYVAPRARSGSRTVDVRVEVDNPDQTLRPGSSAAVRIEVGRREDAVVVPAYAVIQGASGASAWVVGEGDKAEQRSVVIGGRAPAEVQIDSGLAVGDRLILEGFVRLRPGAPVSEPPPAPASGVAP